MYVYTYIMYTYTYICYVYTYTHISIDIHK